MVQWSTIYQNTADLTTVPQVSVYDIAEVNALKARSAIAKILPPNSKIIKVRKIKEVPKVEVGGTLAEVVAAVFPPTDAPVSTTPIVPPSQPVPPSGEVPKIV